MLIRPAILPDEFDRGYLGRVMRFNGVPNKQETLQALRVWAGLPADGGEGLRTGTIALLSQLADLPLEGFVARHTTLPWRRAITWHKTHIDHGGDESESIISISGFRLARDAAYLCPDCVAEDQTREGFAWWRRAHQLPGYGVCEKHHVPLRSIADQWAFLKSPAIFIHKEAHALAAPEEGPAPNPYVLRFHEVAQALMARAQPVSTAVLRKVLHLKGEEKHLQLCGGEVKRPLLSDWVLRVFPHDWLKEVFPAVLGKRERQALNKLDGVFYFANGSSSVKAYFLAMAILFDTADEALKTVEQYEAQPVSRGKRSAGDMPTPEVLIEAYVDAEGRHSAIASRCKISVFVASKQLVELGLPNLCRGRRHRELLRAAYAFYLERRGLLESAAVGGVSVTELEALLRDAGPMLRQALQAIMKANPGNTSLAA